MSNSKPSYFISDAHLGINCPGYETREKHLFQFLRSVRGSAASLFIVGDLFDFWIEYRHAIRPCYFDMLHELRLLIENGTTVHYLAGNHDFALGPFLEKTIGMHLYRDHLEITEQGRRIHLHHGDGLIRREFGYRFLRMVLRNRVNQALYRLLHPDIGIPIANLFSLSSRQILKRTCSEETRNAYRAMARSYLSRGSDIVVFGHTHGAEICVYDRGVYCNTGEWIRRYNYTKLQDGAVSLWQYNADGSSQLLASTSEKRGASAS